MVDASLSVGHHLRVGFRRGDATLPWNSPTLRVVFASTLLAPLGIALISPGLPVIQAQFSLTDAETSLILSSYFLTGIVLSPFIGLLEDRIGRRAVLIPSLLVFSLTGAAIAYAPSYSVALGLRIVQGTAAAGIFISTVTLIGDTFEGVERTSVLGANTAVLSTGAAIFPILGGVLAATSWNAPFFVYLLGIPVALLAYIALDEPSVEHGTHSFGSFRQVFDALTPSEALLLYGSAFMIELLLFGAVFTAIPFQLSTGFGVRPVEIGLVVTAALIASAVAASQAGRLAKHLSDEMLIISGFAFAGVGLLFAWRAGSPTMLGLASVVFGAGWGLVLPSIDDEVSEFVPVEFRAEALSLRNSTTFLGRTIAPILFTALAPFWGYRLLLLVAGAVGFASGLVGWILSR
ncbi:MFS transporter [Haloferax sp. MBLA0077]|uniref:MFS transporter n=3 Tax=Haloferacaceae TaxID=1644056 RepID=A0A6G1Z038_9EURY|nr:MFS transporter [Haloferax sp. CBA1149]MRW79886.1 MFS transporter [Haloferax marinisediminis]